MMGFQHDYILRVSSVMQTVFTTYLPTSAARFTTDMASFHNKTASLYGAIEIVSLLLLLLL